MIAASIISYSSFEATVTRTASGTGTTTTLTSTVTTTTTVTTTSTAVCTEQGATQANATGSGTLIAASSSATDCQLGITLGLAANSEIFTGQNETIFISLTNNLPTPRDVNYTGLPTLSDGLDLSSAAAYDYVLPLQPPCGYPSTSDYEPAFFAVYDGSGAPLQLSDSPVPILNCITSSGQAYHPFNASLTITETLSVGGYYTSPDASEPWVNATYSQFGPGNYTIVAFDPWQQLTERNFTVAINVASPGEVQVAIPSGATTGTGENFEPANFRVVIGVNNTVVFTNDDEVAAVVESTSWPTNGTGFSGLVGPGQSWTLQLSVPGVYTYNNEFRPVAMMGTIVVEPLPLQLKVTLNTTTIQAGGGVLAEISIFNPLAVNVTVLPSYQYASNIPSWNSYDFLCGGNPTWSLAGYALLQGRYTSANLSSAGTPLSLHAPLDALCPVSPAPSAIVFLPHGSSMMVYFQPNNFENATSVAAAMNATTGTCMLTSGYYDCDGTALSGYWTGPPGGYFDAVNATITSPYFHYFPPGQYTLVVEDAWGQTGYAYFEVFS